MLAIGIYYWGYLPSKIYRETKIDNELLQAMQMDVILNEGRVWNARSGPYMKYTYSTSTGVKNIQRNILKNLAEDKNWNIKGTSRMVTEENVDSFIGIRQLDFCKDPFQLTIWIKDDNTLILYSNNYKIRM